MLSSLTAAPMPPASSSTACHRLLGTTCCCSSGFSASMFFSGSNDTTSAAVDADMKRSLVEWPTWRGIAFGIVALHAHVTYLWTRLATAASPFSLTFTARAALIRVGAWRSSRASTVAPELKREDENTDTNSDNPQRSGRKDDKQGQKRQRRVGRQREGR